MMNALSTGAELWTIRACDVPLTTGDRRAITSTLRRVLADFYVHLPQKREALAIDPDQELKVLEHQAPLFASNLHFFNRLIGTFTKLRDRHTMLRLPSPWNRMVAYLPIVLESCYENGHRVLTVTKALGAFEDPKFQVGVEITHWNGVPVKTFIENLSWITAGANPWARIALAQRELTLRPLAYNPPPDEDWVTLTYRSMAGEIRHISFLWRVWIAPSSHRGREQPSTHGPLETELAAAIGLDEHIELVNQGLYELFAQARRGGTLLPTLHGVSGGTLSPPFHSTANTDGLLSASILTLEDSTRFGYLRVFSFSTPDVRAFATDVAAILQQMPAEGLIIDVRANPGGTIPAGEALLHLISDRPIQPARNVFRATDSVRRISEHIDFFADWRRSLELAYETAQTYSQGFALDAPKNYAGLEGSFQGPVIVLTDALSYSTTDYFVAGFKDNNLGTILGLDPTTGAGGANVWNLGQINEFSQQSGLSVFQPLPSDMDARVAVRRAIRTGYNSGLPIEGLGARSDALHYPTRRDLLGMNEDLIIHAANQLRSKNQKR